MRFMDRQFRTLLEPPYVQQPEQSWVKPLEIPSLQPVQEKEQHAKDE